MQQPFQPLQPHLLSAGRHPHQPGPRRQRHGPAVLCLRAEGGQGHHEDSVVSAVTHGVLLCERLQHLWAERCDCVGTVSEIGFDFVGTDEMTVDAYLNSFSFDLEFLTLS